MGLIAVAAVGLAIMLKLTLTLVVNEESILMTITKRIRRDPVNMPLLPFHETLQYQSHGKRSDEMADTLSISSLPSLISGSHFSESDAEAASLLSYPSQAGDPGIIVSHFDL